MALPDKITLNKIKESIPDLSPDQAEQLKQQIAEVIKAFNYQDLKVHGHLNELLLTINTENVPDADNFNDIRKKLIYLIDTILKDF